MVKSSFDIILAKTLGKSLGMLAGGAIVIASYVALFGTGSRETKDIYNFKYQGQSATIKHEDRRLSIDKYWIELENGEIYSGRIKTDENKIIKVNGNKFSVKDN